MTKLERLQISGIRSFGITENDTQSIDFHTPLTLFLGENGCGKTTIIEALKCAVTGDLPGGVSSGSGFVADPNMHKVIAVTGQIKLQMRGPQKQKLIVTKVMRNDLKKDGGTRFSTTDSLLKITDHKGDTVTDTRVTDIHKQIYETLKVPKCIINNVMFCHQENSLWPLDENSKLKLKFDEIFESTEYTKCVDKLRKMHKSSSTEITYLKQDCARKKLENSNVEEKRRLLEDKITKKNDMELDITNKEKELKPKHARLTQIAKLEDELIELNRNSATLENQIRNLEEHQATLLENIKTELTGSDFELEQNLARFNESKEKEEARIMQLDVDKNGIIKSERDVTEKVKRKTAQCVTLKEKLTQYKNKMRERDLLIDELATTLKICVTLKSDDEIKASINALKQSVFEEKNSLVVLTMENDTDNKVRQLKVDECRDLCVEMQQSIKIKKEQIVELQNQSRTIDSQLRELSCSDEQLKKFQSKSRKVELELTEINDVFNAEAVASEIEKSRQKIKLLELELEDLEREYKVLEKNGTIENDLENNKEYILKRQAEIHVIKNKHFEHFNELFVDGLPENNSKNEVQKIISVNTKKVAETTKKITLKQKHITTLETKDKYQREKLKSLEKELSVSQKKVGELCGNTEYVQKCRDIKEDNSRLQKARGQLNSAKVMYEKFIEDLQKRKCCPICTTGFSNNDQALQEIIKTIEAKIVVIPGHLERCEIDLKASNDLLSQIYQLNDTNDKVADLGTKLIPSLTSELNEIKTEISRESKALEELKLEILGPEKLITVSNNVIADVALIDQYRTDISKYEANIEALKAKLVTVSSNRNKRECDLKIRSLKTELSNLRQNYETQNKELNLNRDRLHELNKEQNEIKEQQLALEKLMHGKPQLLETLKDIATKMSSLSHEILESDEKAEQLKTNLAESEKERDEIKEANRKQLGLFRDEVNKHDNHLGEINKFQKIILNTQNDNLEGQFSTLIEEMTKLNERSKDLETSKLELTQKINDLQLQVVNQETAFRALKDNILLRERRKAHAQLVDKLKELSAKIGSKNSSEMIKEKELISREYSALNRSIQKSRGKHEELLDIIKDLTEELEKPEYKNSLDIYLDAYTLLLVTEAAYKDVKVYGEALDNAIVVIHRKRMKAINEAIRILWRQIYKGNDIDYIEIESGETDFQAGTGRRNYNYRVMQAKNGTMLEMRGRCSAGQKVLACLIIRMALSEVFSVNCGILALDEPTTNLDKSNIASLSQSLADIINAKSYSKSFQLLVITHDAEFIHTLKSVNALTDYYRVSRSTTGNSIVTSEDISRL